MPEQNKCYLLEPEPRIVGQMGAFIASTASRRKGVVYLDTDIIPYLSCSELDNATKDTLEPIMEFNSTLVNRVLGHKADRVVITHEIQDEMYANLESALSEIARVTWPKKHHERLAKTYTLLRDSVGSRQLPPESTSVFQTCYEIAQKVLETFPKLKTNQARAKKTDEKLVAHAFAQAIETENNIIIFSNELTVANMAREMYKILVAKNMGGDTKGCALWTPKRLEAHPVEVWGYGLKDGSDKKLFIEKFAKKIFATGFKWESPKEAKSSDALGREKLLRKYVLQEVAAIEEALGNAKEADKFLDILTGAYKESAEEASPAESNAAAEVPASKKPAPQNGLKTIITQGSKRLENKLEEVLYGLMPRGNTETLPPDIIDTTLRRYKALKVLAKELKLPVDRINSAISCIAGRSLPVIIKKLTEETDELVRKKNIITNADPQYYLHDEKRKEVEGIAEQINRNAQRLQKLKQGDIRGDISASIAPLKPQGADSSPEPRDSEQGNEIIPIDLQEPGQEDTNTLIDSKIAALSEKELKLYENLKDKGFDVADTEKEVWVPAEVYANAAGYPYLSTVATKLKKLEKAGKIEREKDINDGRKKLIRIDLNVLPLLVKGSKKGAQ